MSYNPVSQNQPIEGNLNQMEIGQEEEELDKSNGKYSIKFSNKSIRAAFVRKVFALVLLMLCIVSVITAVPWMHKPMMKLIRGNYGLYFLSYFIFLVTYLSLSCCQGVQRTFPWNIIFLSIFTLATSFMTMIISAYHETTVILMSLAICIGCVLTIIVAASQTKFDLTACMGYIVIITMCVTMFGAVAAFCWVFLKINFPFVILAFIGSLLMMIWLFYDIQMLMGERRNELSPEDYIYTSVQIFVDIVQLFWNLLGLMGSN